MSTRRDSMDFRKVERKVGDGWEEVKFHELKKGDHFKLYDDDTGPVYEDGSKVYIATSDTYPGSPEGDYGIDVADVVSK
jgi:hypothetical protein